MRPDLPLLLAGALLCVMLVSCSEHADPDDPSSARIRRFKATHFECNPSFYRKPCQIGPDGRLYEILPGEDASSK